MATWVRTGVTIGLMVSGCVVGLAGCKTKTTTQTEVKDRLLGGKEVKQTEVTEQGDKTQVKETKTKLNTDGTLEERENTVKGTTASSARGRGELVPSFGSDETNTKSKGTAMSALNSKATGISPRAS